MPNLIPGLHSTKCMAEAQCLNQSFKFGLAEQQILKPFAMLS